MTRTSRGAYTIHVQPLPQPLTLPKTRQVRIATDDRNVKPAEASSEWSHIYLPADADRLTTHLEIPRRAHSRSLATVTVSTVPQLMSALSDSGIDNIAISSGTYQLSAELHITRSVTIEAVPRGSVVLDAGASSSDRRRVMRIDVAATDTVELVGLNITGGYEYVHPLHSPLFNPPFTVDSLHALFLSMAPLE